MLSCRFEPTQRKKIYRYYKRLDTEKFSNTSREDLERKKDDSYKKI